MSLLRGVLRFGAIFVIVVLVFYSSPMSEADVLMGCKDPEQFINLVSTLSSTEWKNWNRSKIKGIWNGHLTEKELQSENPEPTRKWKTLVRRGRFTEWCECCETFEFDLNHKSDGTIDERLSSVTIFHTEAKFDDMIVIAQSLLMIILPSERDKIKSKAEWVMDRESNSLYRMYRPQHSSQSAQTFGADVQISKRDGNYTLYLHFFADMQLDLD